MYKFAFAIRWSRWRDSSGSKHVGQGQGRLAKMLFPVPNLKRSPKSSFVSMVFLSSASSGFPEQGVSYYLGFVEVKACLVLV